MHDNGQPAKEASVRLPGDPEGECLTPANVAARAEHDGGAFMDVLALDIGTKMGWALATRATITSGTKDFTQRKRETRGARLYRLYQWLAGIHRGSPLAAIAHEAVTFNGAPNGFLTAQLYGQTLGTILLFAERNNVPIYAVHTATLKKAIAGSGKAKKPEMVAAVRRLGFNPADDNEADALAVLIWKTGARALP